MPIRPDHPRRWTGRVPAPRAALLGAAIAAAPAAHAANYTITTLEYPNALQTFVTAENNSGTAVGYWSDSTYNHHGWIYAGGTLSDFDPPNAPQSYPFSINDKGDVVGYVTDASGNNHGYIYTAATKHFRIVDAPNAMGTVLISIQNDGLIVGSALVGGTLGIFTLKHGTYTTVITTDGADAQAANRKGTIVGFVAPPRAQEHAFYYAGGTFALVPFSGDRFSAAFGVNAKNQIVGQVVSSTYAQTGFLYKVGGTVKLVSPPGAASSFLQAINDTGLAVGSSFDANYNSSVWVYQHGQSTTFGIDGGTGAGAIAVNDAGEIAGDYIDANNVGATFLAVPTQ